MKIQKNENHPIMKNPIIKILIAIFLWIFILIISSMAQMEVLNNKGISDNYAFLEKIILQLVMLTFSILIILLLNKGKLKEYGFNWNLNFPLTKIIIISLAFGFLSSLIGNLFNASTSKMPTSDFTLLEKIMYIWILASICEEVFTRGLIQGYLSSLKHIGLKFFKYYLSLPVLVGAILFGAMHLGLLTVGVNIFIVMTIVVFAILLGLIAGYHKEKTNSLIPAIIVHLCFNIGGYFI